MNVIQLLTSQLEQSRQMLGWTLGDFTDAEMTARPCDAANHALWQLGHLANAEAYFGSTIRPGSMPDMPADFNDRFANKNNHENDPAKLGSKAELLALFNRNRQALIEVVKTLSEADLDKATPPPFETFAPTVGDLIVTTITHEMMHMGQIQAIRRKLGKPVLF